MIQLKNLKTQFIGRNICYYESITSTQDKAKELIQKGQADGTIVIAKMQTKGKGTKGRIWYTGEDNLAFTMILYPKCEMKKLEGITIQIAKCMIQTIKQLYGVQLEIKKPNDIMLNGKKMGGILTQTTTREEKVNSLLIGIGLNIHQTNFPPEIDLLATSLKKELGGKYNIEEIIATFCNLFEKKYTEL